jgi:hypothetical protein
MQAGHRLNKPQTQVIHLDLEEEAKASLLGKIVQSCMYDDKEGSCIVKQSQLTGPNPFTKESVSDRWRSYVLRWGSMCACVLVMCLLLEGPALAHPVDRVSGRRLTCRHLTR